MAQAPIAEFERIANRAKRELMARVPPVGWAVDMRYERRLRHHAGQLAPLSATHTELVSRLRREGAIVTTPEDHRMFKIIIWLNDVSPAGGAFEWLPRPRTQEATRKLGYVSGFVSDHDMEQVMARQLWCNAPGPRWTAVLGDTMSIFHKAGVPQDKDRYSITYSWTSRWPIKPYPIEPFSAAQAEAVRQGLSARQRAALPKAIR